MTPATHSRSGSFVILPVLSLLSAHPARPPGAAPAAPERLVAEASIRTVNQDTHNPQVYLPVTIHGHAATVILMFARIGVEVTLSVPKLTKLGIAFPKDSLTIGTTLAHHLDLQPVQRPFTAFDQPDLPPVVGMAGYEFLDHYDVVVDGPAHRVRLYARAAPPAAAPGGVRAAGLPPGVNAADCTPIQETPEGDPGFAMQADGHPVTGVLQQGHPYTVMNTVAAHRIGLTLGLTQHSPQVQPVPESLQTRFYQGVPDKYLATDIHLTLGRYPFTEVPIHILARAPLEPTPTTPTIELKFENLLGQVFVFSNSTGQVCLGEPR